MITVLHGLRAREGEASSKGRPGCVRADWPV